MAVLGHPSALLGISVGGIHTRAALFAKPEGKYQVMGSQHAQTSLGQGSHLGIGIGQVLSILQETAEHPLLKESGGLVMPADRYGNGVDRVAMVVSAGARVPTHLLGLSKFGSVKAGKALLNGLPIELVNTWGLEHLGDDGFCIEQLIKTMPKILALVGGEDTGNTILVEKWVEIIRTACELMPKVLKPVVVFAGCQAFEPSVRRRLEPVTKLSVTSNIQPEYGVYDFAPARNTLEQVILENWKAQISGLPGLFDLTKGLYGLTSAAMDRMVRFLSRAGSSGHSKGDGGALLLDLGSNYTTVSISFNGYGGTIIKDKFPSLGSKDFELSCQSIYKKTGMDLSEEDVERFLSNYAMIPTWIPETLTEMALLQAFCGHRLQKAMDAFSENFPWYNDLANTGLHSTFDTVIVSGAEITQTPNQGWTLLTLLDAIQPRGITNIHIDKFHVLPLLGKIGELEPILTVQILASNAFENLGTVVTAIGALPHGKTAVTAHVETESGKAYSAEIQNGELQRLLIPMKGKAEVELIPHPEVDIGFGGFGRGGRLNVVGGGLGLVVDARGRPLRLPDQKDLRIDTLQKWLRIVGVDLG